MYSIAVSCAKSNNSDERSFTERPLLKGKQNVKNIFLCSIAIIVADRPLKYLTMRIECQKKKGIECGEGHPNIGDESQIGFRETAKLFAANICLCVYKYALR